jgi:MATE family multidrug resistance protein
MTKYLQSQHILGPPVYIGLLANALNFFLNWLLVFHLGYGFDGAPVVNQKIINPKP